MKLKHLLGNLLTCYEYGVGRYFVDDFLVGEIVVYRFGLFI